jgi:hypothetical protein
MASSWEILFLSDSCGFLDVAHSLSREDRSVLYSYNCFWVLPEQSLSGPSPAELTTICYGLIWDSPRPGQSQSHITTYSQSWCQAPTWEPRPIFFFLLEILFRQLRASYFVEPSLTRGRVCKLLLLLVLASTVSPGSALSDERSGLSFVSISL